ncbi:MAG: ATP-binding cassette domain-containing protein [Spirochaetia bacterium]|nr:ATP-binding cassette domain-containing protein [Spirochaetia bacterium]
MVQGAQAGNCPVIEVQELTKKFTVRKRKPGFLGSVVSLFSPYSEEMTAVDKVNFTIGRGDLVGYLGPNGAGKSTTIKMLTGILVPTSGRVMVDGVDPQEDRRAVARKIGVVFGQKTQLWWDLPVEESFDLLRAVYKIPRREYQQRLDFFINLLHMKDFLSQQTRKLSLGQRMRADLAASLLHRPPILFLDEPTIGLDILTRDIVRKFIKEINEKEQITILLTTHDIQDIEYLARRLILLDRGRVHYDGGIQEFVQRYAAEKVLTIQVDPPCGAEFFTSLGYEILSAASDRNFEIRLGAQETPASLIEQLTEKGIRIDEINMRKRDLGDTLKLMYSNQQNVEL